MLLAFDSTDSPAGGCTSRVLLDVLADLPGLVPKGLPRLVRLNPNAPWKTRGNAAVCVALGTPQGPFARGGEWRGAELRVHPEAGPAPASDALLEHVWTIVRKAAQPEAAPAVVLLDEAPPQAAYWQAVRGVVEPEEAHALLAACGAWWRADGDGRAAVGALAAASWPGPPSSYEFTAYREPHRWGTPRLLETGPLRILDATGATFHTWDVEAERPACVPKTPCPVLLGLRGRDPDALAWAATTTLPHVVREPVDAWVLWATNQASGDHVATVPRVREAPPLATVEVEATVEARPEPMRGGHVRVRLRDAAGDTFHAVAFEPTHALAAAARQL
ncbi:MAG TPA: DUF1743 domain-containing protein, partial [Candidatus Thermoplasmatota archaeon]|nr:DUF1743 domain-containing protein [Candidatus Thermoplasmatota archaeon]